MITSLHCWNTLYNKIPKVCVQRERKRQIGTHFFKKKPLPVGPRPWETELQFFFSGGSFSPHVNLLQIQIAPLLLHSNKEWSSCVITCCRSTRDSDLCPRFSVHPVGQTHPCVTPWPLDEYSAKNTTSTFPVLCLVNTEVVGLSGDTGTTCGVPHTSYMCSVCSSIWMTVWWCCVVCNSHVYFFCYRLPIFFF
jgi:hypothetical protein